MKGQEESETCIIRNSKICTEGISLPAVKRFRSLTPRLDQLDLSMENLNLQYTCLLSVSNRFMSCRSVAIVCFLYTLRLNISSTKDVADLQQDSKFFNVTSCIVNRYSTKSSTWSNFTFHMYFISIFAVGSGRKIQCVTNNDQNDTLASSTLKWFHFASQHYGKESLYQHQVYLTALARVLVINLKFCQLVTHKI